MSAKEYPENKPPMQRTVRIPVGLHGAIEEFLKTATARRMGYRYKTDVVTEAVRQLFIGYGFYPMNPEGWGRKEKAEEPRE